MYWTRDRVLTGLTLFAADTGVTPTSTKTYGELKPATTGQSRTEPGRYPSVEAILRHFSSMEEAWAACGISVQSKTWYWSSAEEELLRQNVGKVDIETLAQQLGRAPSTVINRAYALGLKMKLAEGVSIEQACRWTGQSRYLIEQAISKNLVGTRFFSKYVYVDPADLLRLPGLDVPTLPPAAEARIRQALMERLVLLLSFGDARHGSLYTYGPLKQKPREKKFVYTLPAGWKDRTGERYGKLVIKRLQHFDLKRKQPFWLCHCDCGGTRTVLGHCLFQGPTSVKACVNCTSLKRLGALNKKKRKYQFTTEIDEQIKALYAKRRNTTSDRMPEMENLAQEAGFPKWALRKRAQELGLTRVKEDAWTPAENAIIQQWAHLVPDRINVKLREAGFKRTDTAVRLQRKRLKFNLHNQGQYSASAVAYGFGIDQHAVVKWINDGKLVAERAGTKRKTDKQGGDHFLISREAVREFIFLNPMAFDLGKVDQLWFMHVVSDGLVEMTRKVAKRGKRPEEVGK